MICSVSSIKEIHLSQINLFVKFTSKNIFGNLFEYLAVKLIILGNLQWCTGGHNYDALTSVDDT
jgi:hypothetical protein